MSKAWLFVVNLSTANLESSSLDRLMGKAWLVVQTENLNIKVYEFSLLFLATTSRRRVSNGLRLRTKDSSSSAVQVARIPPSSASTYVFTYGNAKRLVRAFAHGAMGRRIDPSSGGPIELFLAPASAPRLV